jgi:beta-galactosidase
MDLKYVPQVRSFFEALHNIGITADVVSPDADLSKYKLVIAPVLYMIKPGVAEALEEFVADGGTFVTTYFSGIADETDLIFEGGYPGPLRDLLGIWAEEIDILSPRERNAIIFNHAFGELAGEHACTHICDLVHLESAKSVARYASDFYAGRPALTVNTFGEGRAYYLATQVGQEALRPLCRAWLDEAGITPPLGHRPPPGVEVTRRISPDGTALLYLLNHNANPVSVDLPSGSFRDLLGGEPRENHTTLPRYGVQILQPVL